MIIKDKPINLSTLGVDPSSSVGPVTTGSPSITSKIGNTGFGPLQFPLTPTTQSVRVGLSGTVQTIQRALQEIPNVLQGGKPGKLQGMLSQISRGLGAKVLSEASIKGSLTESEQLIQGVELGRSLRSLSHELGKVQDQVSRSHGNMIPKFMSDARAALADGPGVLPSVRLPAATGTINGHTLRIEQDDVALLGHPAFHHPNSSGVLKEILHANPGDPMMVLDIIAAKDKGPIKAETALARLAHVWPKTEDLPGGMAALRKTLSADLSYRGSTLEGDMVKLMGSFGINDPEPLLDMLATAREAFKRGAAGTDEVPANDFDTAGWLHTRLEMLHSLQALDTIRDSLPAEVSDRVNWPQLAKATWLGTLSSDLFKTGDFNSILGHNRDGAELMVPLLASRHLGEVDGEDTQRIMSLAKRIAHDHQVVPAGFMGMLAELQLTGFFQNPSSEAASIKEKISNPFAAEQKDGELVFTEPEKALLREKGISGWPAPSAEGDLERILGSLAAIVGDAAQYPSEDAVAKYAVHVRGPDKGGPMHNPVISSMALAQVAPHALKELQAQGSEDKPESLRGSMESAFHGSHEQSMQTLRDGVSAFGEETTSAVQGYLEQLQQQTAGKLAPFFAEVDKEIRARVSAQGRNPDEGIPFWTQPVPEAADGQPEHILADVALVKSVFEQKADEILKVPAKPFEISGGAS